MKLSFYFVLQIKRH